MRRLAWALAALVLLAALALFLLERRYGGGEPFPDRTGPPTLPGSALEKVADLDLPPGNIALSPDGRLFFSFHPEAHPPVAVAEWIDGRAVPYPPGGLPDGLAFQSVLSVRIDRQGRLWVLDYAHHGTGQARLLGFELASDRLVHRFDFPREIAPLGSHLNDFQVSPDGRHVYIADASILRQSPALVVYDVESRRARRLLEGHPSVRAERFLPAVEGKPQLLFGIFAVRPGVDSIALDQRGEWLYFAPVSNRHMARVRSADLLDETLSAEALAARVERFAEKTMSDGITIDSEDRIYIADLEHSAVVRLHPDGRLETLLRDPRLRWPDGFGWGPDGWLYVTCSALHQVIMRSPGFVAAHAPFQIYRFQPGGAGIPGH